jgi:hypothetical protein
MPPPVHILATCRRPELAEMTELVFKTLRVGFPTASITVHLNGQCADICIGITALCKKNGAEIKKIATIHHRWIEQLVATIDEPFYILDTDVIFYSSVEGWTFDTALAGFLIPEWQDEFAGAVTRSRLHPSLLYVDPLAVRKQLSEFRGVCPDSPFTPFGNPFYPVCLPLNRKMFFHDTCSLLYHAIGGTPFTNEQKDAYFHFNFGTISDIVLPRLSDGQKMHGARRLILNNPEMGRGAWRFQEEYYATRQNAKSPLPLPEISKPDMEEAIKWNKALCGGDDDAMQFNDLWYRYCHGIDDLIDTMEDGRPKMNADQILELFITAAFLYNCPFYRKHREYLFTTVMLVTNSFGDSVLWEKSPLSRRRIMADCLRTCGDEMYYMVALICGGWKHMRNVSPAIRERDWLGQHDMKDNPT